MNDYGGEFFLNGKVQLFNGDSREVLKRLPDNSIDSVVTDPPYALVSIVKRFGSENAAPAKGNEAYQRASAGFMGRAWDTGETAFAVEFWAEVMRVLKPGGHVVAASGTRTYHRLAVAIEDAGFEIRDTILWLYGSGFPKSHDVERAINKAAGVEYIAKPASGVGFMGADGPGGYNPTINQLVQEGESTPEAAQWSGWGTALKPACEPWVLARKPLIGTVAANVLEHGTGAINVDGCRVGWDGPPPEIGTPGWGGPAKKLSAVPGQEAETVERTPPSPLGRWPANVIHDGSDEVVAGFPSTAPAKASNRGALADIRGGKFNDAGGVIVGSATVRGVDDAGGSAARFFYSAKADKLDRAGSKHPTVKPVDLMQYLCRLITPPGGIVLDPFAGSGSTGEAAWREGFRCVLIEREEEYAEDIRQRLRLANQGTESRKRAIAKKKGGDEPIGGLFA